MKVNLKHNWFAGGVRYRKRNNPVELPDSFADKLPPGAVVVRDGAVPVKEPELDPSAEFKRQLREEGALPGVVDDSGAPYVAQSAIASKAKAKK